MDILKELVRERDTLQEKLNAVKRAIEALSPSYGFTETNEGIKSDDQINLASSFSNVHSDRAKGNRTWKSYVLWVASLFDEGFQTSDVAKFITDNNPDISEDRIHSASRHYLWKLKGEDKIEAVETNSRKEGFTYRLKKD